MTGAASEKPAGGSGWTAVISVLGNSSQQISSFVIMLLAAGFLGVADYGVYSLAIIFVEFVVLLTYAGFYHFIVTSDADEEAVCSTIFWVLLAIGTAGGVLMIVLSVPAARVFDAPDLAPVMRLFGLIQPVASVISWASAVMTRQGLMRRFFMIQIVSNLAAMILGSVMLILWQSLFALVLYQATRSLVGLVLFGLAVPRMPKMRFDRGLFRSAARYAAGLYGARSLTFVSVFGIDILLALLFSTADSGLYRFANRLATASVDIIAQPLRSFSLKSFGQAVRQGRSLTPVFADYFAGTLLLTGGVAATVFVLGPALIKEVFRPDYLLAVGAMQALCLRATARAGQSMIEPTFSATGRTSSAFYNNLVVSSAMILVVTVTAPFGYVAVSWVQAALQALSVPFSLWIISRFSPIDLRPGLRAARSAAMILVGYAAALWIGWRALGLGIADDLLRLVAGGCLALALAIVAVRMALRRGGLSPALFTQ